MAGRIVVTIELLDSVTMEQFTGVVRHTSAQLSQFQHLIASVDIQATPPSLVSVPLNITVSGLPVDAAAENVLAKVAEALKSVDGVQYTVQVVGAVAETPLPTPEQLNLRPALAVPTVSKEGVDVAATPRTRRAAEHG